MDSDDDVQVIYDSCSSGAWETARENLKKICKTEESDPTSVPSTTSASENTRNHSENYQIWRQDGERVMDSCIGSSSKTIETEDDAVTSNSDTSAVPPSVKLELIDILDGEDDTSSVELLEDDSEYTIGAETALHKDPTDHVESDEMKAILPNENNLLDPAKDGYTSARSRTLTLSETSSVENRDQFFMELQGTNRTSTPSTSSQRAGPSGQSPVKPSATRVWRERCQSPMSTYSTDSEYSAQLPFFMGTYSTRSVASSFVRNVDRMRIDEESESRARTPQPISLDEVSSTSDLSKKKMSGVQGELAMAARWAEDHDLGLDDEDEFLECEDEDRPPSTRDEQITSTERNRPEETRKGKTASSNRYRCRSHKRTKSTRQPSDRDKVDHRSAPRSEQTAGTSTGNVRKRNSSPIQRQLSSPRERGEQRKRFASDRTSERRRDQTQSRSRESPPRSNQARSPPTDPKRSTASAKKAQSLPRYVPADRRYDFTRWIDSKGDFVLHKIKDVATGLVSAPLGCTYDSSLDTFVFTRHDSILFSTSEGRILDSLTLKGFDQPCAICILRPGAAMGILDRSNLYLYEPKLKRLSIVADGLGARHRALSYTCNGDFITVKKHGSQLSATIFDATDYNKIIGSFVFPQSDGVSVLHEQRQPCFADTTGNQIFFTDLRTNTLTCMEMEGNRLVKVYSRCMQQSPTHRGEEARKRFVFMSGIRCDDSGHLLVADAKNRTLKLLTTSGQILKCAKFANGASFPYCSAFGVSPSGMLMACDRANSRMVLFRIGEESVSEDAVITDDVFDRMMGETGVENEVRRLKERARRAA
ncbi:unnamed protein product [Haemonchus placei]|uniref:BRCT domain-containing protein n=1 Tax=Haemonchus placei TaxID=6290 RepID=A0A158QQY0_HAEPC|nr:unnamed protein product [Haemonchus placei]